MDDAKSREEIIRLRNDKDLSRSESFHVWLIDFKNGKTLTMLSNNCPNKAAALQSALERFGPKKVSGVRERGEKKQENKHEN